MRQYKGPIFAHRHYAAIAAILAGHFEGQPPAGLVAAFTREFRSDNPRFDTLRFEAAAFGEPSNGKDRR